MNRLAGGDAVNLMFGSTIPQALEHTGIFLICVLYKFSFLGSPAIRGSHRSRVVEAFMRRTALAGMERFFNLRIFAEKSYVLNANEKIAELEKRKENAKGQPLQQGQQGGAGAGAGGGDGKQETPNIRSLNFVFGFHPHGILAMTCAWLPISNVWRKMGLPKRVSRFGASIIFNVPLLRDAAMSMGARVVTKEAIHRALSEADQTVSAMLVPGGQAEMLESRASHTEVYVKNHHKGFLRIALQENKPAVPVFCFGEHDFIENIQLPKVQKFFLKLVGFGLPVVPMGALGILPLPRRIPLTIVVGKPIDPQEIREKMNLMKKTHGTTSSGNMNNNHNNSNNHDSKPTSPTAASTTSSERKKETRKKNKKSNSDDEEDRTNNRSNTSNNNNNDNGNSVPHWSESDLVDLFADEYFAELKRVFYKYREEAGYPKMELIFTGKD